MNTLCRNGRSLLVTSCVAGLSLAGASVSLAQAATKPYQQFIDKSCGNVASCFIEFPDVPAQSQVQITSVSCNIITGNAASRILYINARVRNPQDDIVGVDAMTAQFTGQTGIGAFHVANTQTLIVLRARWSIELDISATAISSTFAQCKIAGSITN
jgi:hypothetical protein